MIKELNNYWIDENNNTWNKNRYTKEKATVYSKTLVNCYNCRDCHDCSFCRDCNGCDNCSYCYDYCYDCYDCSSCNFCHNCSNCSYCSNCSNCSNCHACSYCRYCNYCSDCKENPQQYITAKIGRRKSATHFYWTNKDDVRVVCGCFRGNLEEFEKAVLKTHENNKTHREAYLKEIEKVKFLIS